MRSLKFVGATAAVFVMVAMMSVSSLAADQIGAACKISSDSESTPHCLTMTGGDIVQARASQNSRGGR